jgi:glycosidase
MPDNSLSPSQAVLEFHVSRQARDRYQFDQAVFSTTGNVIFADFLAARQFAQKMNEQRDLVRHPEQAVRAGQLNAMALVDELLHMLVEQYRRQRNPAVTSEAMSWLRKQLGKDKVGEALRRFTAEFPPLVVYRGQVSVEEYLAGQSRRLDGGLVSNDELALEEMLMLWLANQNPAFQPFLELFNDVNLAQHSVYPQLIPALYEFFAGQPSFGSENENLIDMLRAPARAYPDSLVAQLSFIRQRWIGAGFLPPDVLRLMLTSEDMVREEEKPVFPPGGPGPALALEYESEEYWYEPERFSRDLDWMPNLVLIAKNSYVWLDQLARKYKRPIQHLDQVPDAELDLLASWGVTGLWLIGLWERSLASQRIKQMRGNPDAVASAYSLFSYDIAADLGGELAYNDLRERAWRRGIRLASDMVPNHMGIDSRWVIEHPDWFVQLHYAPFPTYTFNGPNLSWDDRVGIFLEDHYYDNSDAAVVFKRVDFWTGDARYIYHGNDGTSMPWNDTAQLNYLLPEVREAVIQTILHVARKFPVIRFDAAMTLAKRHYQRLWHPEPGSGGDIPSRAEHGLTKEQFDEAFPEEFWRMVVDRVAQEVPDTLLLAEAFWLMEGYFVRTLGMHRVYNSAFMNMLRDEKNQEYRLTLKNTMEFDPEILKRFVNFMNNPDERTAIDQFGKGDKYFGVCTMLATLPGLPMLGHGQIEGFTEKYGMEFRYPKWHEQPDVDLVARHERQIFPLLRRRYLFAEALHFLLYDLYTPEGAVDEDVFAYSNGAGEQRALVVYHNRYAEARGWLNRSAAYAVKTGEGDEKALVQKTLAEGLRLRDEPGMYTIFRDHISGLEYLRSSQELCQQGLYLELDAYQCHVFLDFRQVFDEFGHYARLSTELGLSGVPSVEDAVRERLLQPVLAPFRELVNPGMLAWLMQNRLDAETSTPQNFEMALEEVETKYAKLLQAIRKYIVSGGPVSGVRYPVSGVDEAPLVDVAAPEAGTAEQEAPQAMGGVDPEPGLVETAGMVSRAAIPEDETIDDAKLAQMVRDQVQALLSYASLVRTLSGLSPQDRAAMQYLAAGPVEQVPLAIGEPAVWGFFLSALLTLPLEKLLAAEQAQQSDTAWLDEWLLAKIVAETLRGMGMEASASARRALLLKVLAATTDWFDAQAAPEALARDLLARWLAEANARRYLLVHPYDGVLWFNKESFEDLTWWTAALQIVRSSAAQLEVDALQVVFQAAQALLDTKERSGYRVEKLLGSD